VGPKDSVGELEVEGWLLGLPDGILLRLGSPDGINEGASLRLGSPEGVKEGASLIVGFAEGLDDGCPLAEGLKLGMVELATLGLEEGASLSVGLTEGIDDGCPLTEGPRLGAMLGLNDGSSSRMTEARAFGLAPSSLRDRATNPSSRPISARIEAADRSPSAFFRRTAPDADPNRFVGRGVSLLVVSLLTCPSGKACSASPCFVMITSASPPSCSMMINSGFIINDHQLQTLSTR